MNYPQLTRADVTSVEVRCLREVVKVISLVGRKTHPEVFAHVQPHAHATANLARRFAVACGCVGRGNVPRLDEMEAAAYVHDVGKYFIAPSLLLKPGELDEEERAAISLHSVLGATAISKVPGITRTIHQTVLHHHEHWDGSGYPEGLTGSSIPLVARLVAVVDVYTSLRSRRSYKRTLTKREAFDTLAEMAGRELDPGLVGDFVKWAK
ncbi:MAG TPA: HD domain-containing phosphohydrolase [Pyrinomonadaceae bacterium]|nr:HD domain-containing phosphohydrolase [Pyrinomonadaceae bacterium]